LSAMVLGLSLAACSSTGNATQSRPTWAPTGVLSTAPTSPTTLPNPAECKSGTVYLAFRIGDTTSICLFVGSVLEATYPSPNSFYGSWSRPTVLDTSVVRRQSASTRGNTLSASYRAVGQGSTLVDASFDQTCAPRDQTPCTIPPQLGFLLQVTVISRS
jgi:hypothetical protein